MSKKIREECGVFAVFSKNKINIGAILYKGMLAIQHRGQDAAGLSVYDGEKIITRKGLGLVGESLDIKNKGIPNIKGYVGIAHTRYPTTGRCEESDVQPSVWGELAVSHNGHIANYNELRAELENKGWQFEGTVDSEIFLYMIAEEYKKNKTIDGILEGIRKVMQKVNGAYSDVMIAGDSLVVFRDPKEIRPLVWGEGEGIVAFASESIALDINDIEYRGEVKGGSAVIVNSEGRREVTTYSDPAGENKIAHCMFEYVYFSRPDSMINGKSVYSVREALGRELAKESPARKEEIDYVIPVPDTSRAAAMAYAKELGLQYHEGLIKNRYVARTFIMPTQEERAKAVRIKLNPIIDVLKGKRIVLIDDSIVRGTTLKEIVGLVRKAGAKEVHVKIPAPPIRHPCFYGVNIPTYEELIANKKSVEEIRKHINADSLYYLSIDGLRRAIGQPICVGCLNGEYPTNIQNIQYKNKSMVGE